MKKVLRGQQREETSRFIAFRSHWRFAAEFCTPAEAHEKGGIESEAGYFRRNHWVPVPKARNLEDSTHSYWPPFAPTNGVRSLGKAGRWAR